MQAFDPRIVQVSLEINGVINTYEDLAITAKGTKYANSLQNECEVTIANLDKATRDYILTQTSPFNKDRTPKNLIIKAGRQSYGVSKIYEGNIVSSLVSQPPDITIALRCLTGAFFNGNILSRGQPGYVTMSQLSKSIASDIGANLNFQAEDKNISNYAYSGSSLKQINHLGAVGGVNVFLDDNTLVVKNAFVPIDNTAPIRILNANSGMIGIPEFTEQGIRVKFLLDNKTILGGAIQIESQLDPATNGTYVIYKLGFEIATRDTPFYYIAEASRML